MTKGPNTKHSKLSWDTILQTVSVSVESSRGGSTVLKNCTNACRLLFWIAVRVMSRVARITNSYQKDTCWGCWPVLLMTHNSPVACDLTVVMQFGYNHGITIPALFRTLQSSSSQIRRKEKEMCVESNTGHKKSLKSGYINKRKNSLNSTSPKTQTLLKHLNCWR